MYIEIQMTSHGTEAERCAKCEKPIPRGARMSGLRYDNGDPAGWWCDSCIEAERRKPINQPTQDTVSP